MVAIANKPHYSTICAEEPPRYGNSLQKNMMAGRVNKLKQIEIQNHKFLDRLQRVSSNFSVLKWEEARKMQEHRLDKGLHGIKHSHIFKAGPIVKKQKQSRRYLSNTNQS